MTLDRRTVLQSALVSSLGLGISAPVAAREPAPNNARPPLKNPDNGGPLPENWLAATRVPLWPKGVPGTGYTPTHTRDTWWPVTFINNIAEPEMHVFRPARPNGRALVVFPGGSYVFLSIHNEGSAIARAFTDRGYTVFVVSYRLPCEGWNNRADVPLQDAQRALRLARSMAPDLGFNPAAVTIAGFSAGGHLAASLLTGYGEALLPPVDAVDRLSARPDAAMLVYPVITVNGPFCHAGSAAALLGATPDAALVARRSPVDHVTAQCPPTFLVHAMDDGAVPFQNTLLMSAALVTAGKSPETHFFAEGGHGFGLGPTNAPAGQWSSLAMQWDARNPV